jgi:hypothetical protein
MNAWHSLVFGQQTSFDPFWSMAVFAAGGLIAFELTVILFQWDHHNQELGRSPIMVIIAMVPYILAAIFLR